MQYFSDNTLAFAKASSLISEDKEDIFNAFNKFLFIKRLHRLDRLLEVEFCH